MLPHELKPYSILACDNLEYIQRECYEVILSNKESWNEQMPWSGWDRLAIDLYKSCPSLTKWVTDNNWKIKVAAVTILDNEEKRKKLPIHIDQLPVLSRINIPILNCDQAVIKWFHISQDYRNTLDLTNINNCLVDPAQCTQFDELILTRPIVFNTQIAHSVDPLPDARLPRIMLSLTLFSDVSNFLI